MAIPVPGYRVGTAYRVPGRMWALKYHTGVDFPAPVGARVVSMTGGRVIHAGWGGWGRAYGAHVIVDDGQGHRHGYMHLSRTTVTVGQQVTPGQQLGAVGVTGNTTGPHCHVESRRAPFTYGADINPAGFFDTGGSASGGRPVVYVSKLRPGQQDSDSVRHLQRRLNGVHLQGGRDLPVTGNFGDLTFAEVKKWQQKVAHDPPDGLLGPRQCALLFGAGFDIKP